MVTNVDCKVKANGTLSSPFPDISAGLAMGELGCWIDSSETRMTQAGVEHTRIPDAIHLMGMDFLHSAKRRVDCS